MKNRGFVAARAAKWTLFFTVKIANKEANQTQNQNLGGSGKIFLLL